MTICHQSDNFIGPDLGGGGGGVKMASSKEYLSLCLSAKRYLELVEGKMLLSLKCLKSVLGLLSFLLF